MINQTVKKQVLILFAASLLITTLFLNCAPTGEKDPNVSSARFDGDTGGELTLGDLKMEIPGGAMANGEQTLSVKKTDKTIPGVTLGSPVYEFSPSGTKFFQPVKVTVPYTGSLTDPVVYWSKPDGTYLKLRGTVDNGKITVYTQHFSTAAAGEGDGNVPCSSLLWLADGAGSPGTRVKALVVPAGTTAIAQFTAYSGASGGVDTLSLDLNNDGYPDLITIPLSHSSEIKIFSGQDGSALTTHPLHGKIAFPNQSGGGVFNLVLYDDFPVSLQVHSNSSTKAVVFKLSDGEKLREFDFSASAQKSICNITYSPSMAINGGAAQNVNVTQCLLRDNSNFIVAVSGSVGGGNVNVTRTYSLDRGYGLFYPNTTVNDMDKFHPSKLNPEMTAFQGEAFINGGENGKGIVLYGYNTASVTQIRNGPKYLGGGLDFFNLVSVSEHKKAIDDYGPAESNGVSYRIISYPAGTAGSVAVIPKSATGTALKVFYGVKGNYYVLNEDLSVDTTLAGNGLAGTYTDGSGNPINVELTTGMGNFVCPATPAVPTNFNAAAVSASQINLTWTNSAVNETGYKIERSTDNISWTLIHTTAADATSYNSTGLTANTLYYYRIRSTNTVGDSANVAAQATTADIPPTAPSGLSATPISSSQIDLSWTDNSANETGFKVERSTDNSTWTLIATTAANATSYSSSGLSASTLYYYRVRGTNSGGDSSNATASATTTSAAPTAPSGLSATPISSSQINLSWTDNSANETGFKVERSTDNSTWTLITTTAADATSYSSTGLSPGTLYYYRVRATGVGGDSTNATAQATTQDVAPSAPTGLSANPTSSTAINLLWTDNSSNETGFKIERSLDNSTWTLIHTTAANVATYNNTGLTATTLYYYRVRATNLVGDSANATASATTNAAEPTAPDTLVVTPGMGQTDMMWNDNSSNETGFEIERSATGGGAGFTQIGTTPANTSVFSDLTPLSGDNYYRVRAMNGTSPSSWSNEFYINMP